MENYLVHHGIKGMHWGVRRSPEELGHRQLKKMAKKDAQEYARAKMYYGEGAGNRRKLINATVKQRSRSKEYSDLFNQYLNEQDMAYHASKANKERARADRKNSMAYKTGKTFVRTALYTGAGIAGTVAATYYMNNYKTVNNAISKKWSEVKNSAKRAKLARDIGRLHVYPGGKQK